MMKCQVLLTSSVVADRPVCPGEEITFICEVQSPIIAWASEEFIGQGGAQLVFSSFDSPGVVLQSRVHPSTFAKLVEVVSNDINHRLVSELHIVTSLPQSASVSCIDVSNGYRSTYHFIVDGMCMKVVTYA